MHKLSALVFVLFAWYSISAQPSQTAFLHYSTDQGLSNDHITAITKDKRGFLWISTVLSMEVLLKCINNNRRNFSW